MDGESMTITDAEFADFARRLDAKYRDDLGRAPEPTYVDPLGRSRWTSDYLTLRASQGHEAAWSEVNRRINAIIGLPPPGGPSPQPPPVSGLVRPVQGYVRAQGRRWADDSGLRSFRVCSWFPAVRLARDDWPRFLAELDQIAAHWQGVRIFWHLKHAFWAGYEVDPFWPDFDAVFGRVLRACAERGIRVSLSAGDMQLSFPSGERSGAEREMYQRIAGLCASVDQTTVSWTGIWNEGWQNAATPTPRYAAELSRIWQAIYPWGAHALSDPFGAPGGSEDHEHPAGLDAWSIAPSNCTLVHGTRDFPHSLRRDERIQASDVGAPTFQQERRVEFDEVREPVDHARHQRRDLTLDN
jgi:hypothetical protein